MKTLIYLSLIIAPLQILAQSLSSYRASNGITYKVGDEIKLGRGSAPNGDFLYLQMGGWGAVLNHDFSKGSDQHNIGRHYSGLAVTIKKIKKQRVKGHEKVYFTVGGGNITNYLLYIEDAIATCEIADCNQYKSQESDSDKYDRLKKLKALLDEGILTQEEYDKEKKKILEENN